MNKLKQQLTSLSPLSVGLILIFAAAMTFLVFRSFAAVGPATLYSSPSGTQKVTKGKTFTAQIRISTASNVQVAGAAVYMSYTSSKLSVQSVSYNGSPYTIEATPSTNSGGVLHMERAALPAISGGDRLFATVTFKATASGSATIGFTSSSYVTTGDSSSSSSDLPLQTKGTIYSISSTSSGSTGGTSSSHPKSSSSSSSTSSTSSTSSDSSTSADSTSSTKPSDNKSSSSPPAKKSNSAKPEPKSADSISAITDTGAIEVLVVDQSQQPVRDAQVTVGGKTVKTGDNGTALFDKIPVGKADLVVDYKGHKTFGSAEVKSASTTSDPASVTVSIKRSKVNPLVWFIFPLILLLAITAFIFRKSWIGKLKNNFTKDSFSQDTDDYAAMPTAQSSEVVSPKPFIKVHEQVPPGSTFKPGNEELKTQLPDAQTQEDNKQVHLPPNTEPSVQVNDGHTKSPA